MNIFIIKIYNKKSSSSALPELAQYTYREDRKCKFLSRASVVRHWP